MSTQLQCVLGCECYDGSHDYYTMMTYHCVSHTIAPALTVENIVSALTGIERRWDKFGANLYVPKETMSGIRRQYSTDGDRLRQIIVYVLSLHPLASWREIINALHWIEEDQLAESIQEYAEPMTGMCAHQIFTCKVAIN